MPSVSIAVDPDIQAAANFASAIAPLPAKATMTTRFEPLALDALKGLTLVSPPLRLDDHQHIRGRAKSHKRQMGRGN
jgi:hypothetical protein